MAQDVSTENVHLQQEEGAEDVYSPLRDILKREDENDRKPENNLANQLLHALGKNLCFQMLETSGKEPCYGPAGIRILPK